MQKLQGGGVYKLKLAIGRLPKSLNVELRTHWRKQRRRGKAWDLIMALECRGRLPEKPLAKARIRLVRHFWQQLDYDGLVGSMKPVVDALVTAGVLSDDRWSVTGPWIVDQAFRPKKDGELLEIEIEEA